MNLVNLLAAIGMLDRVTWRSRTDPNLLVRVVNQADDKVTLDHQVEDGSWSRAPRRWDVEEFLKSHEPVR